MPSQNASARMAESVDALVSNTSRFTPVPVRPRLRVRKREVLRLLFFLSPKPRSFSRWRCGRVVCSWADGCCATFVFEKRLYLKIDFRTSFSNPDNLRLHLPCSLCSNLRRPFNPSYGCVKVGKIKMRGRFNL